MTSGGLTREEALRLQGKFPPPGPITERDAITRLLDVAALLLHDQRPGAIYDLAEIMDTLRTCCLGEGYTIADADVTAALPGNSLKAVEGGWCYR